MKNLREGGGCGGKRMGFLGLPEKKETDNLKGSLLTKKGWPNWKKRMVSGFGGGGRDTARKKTFTKRKTTINAVGIFKENDMGGGLRKNEHSPGNKRCGKEVSKGNVKTFSRGKD